MGVTALACVIIAILALKYGEQDIKKSDKLALIASFSAILPWMMTNDPFWSVILISLIDTIAMFPTLRKSWYKPYDENLFSYVIANTKYLLSLAALTNLTVTTTLYPITTALVNTSLIFLCVWRRRFVQN